MVGLEESEFPLWSILILCCTVLIYKPVENLKTSDTCVQAGTPVPDMYATQPGTIWKNLGVPSPPSAPFIGHMHRIYDPETGFRGSISNWTKEHGKIFGILFFRDPMLVVTDIDVAREVLVKDFSNFTNRYGGADGLYQPIMQKSILLNGDANWKRVRRIMSPSFSHGKLKLLTSHINRNAFRLVNSLEKQIESGTSPEAKVVFSAFSLDVLAGVAFGLDLDCQNNLQESFYQHAKGLVTFSKSVQLVIAALGAFPFLGALFRLLNVGFFNSGDIDYFKDYFSKLISERKKDEESKCEDVDLFHFLINGEHDSSENNSAQGGMTTEEIVAQSIIMVIAGYETTSATLQWLTYELSKHGNVQNRIRKEIDDVIGDAGECDVTYEQCKKLKYTEAVIHEALRMYPPVVTLSRVSKTATKLKGFSIPADAAVIIPVYNICRDQDVFENPHTFNPDRFMTDELTPTRDFLTALPFGFGPRQCLGHSLAILQVKIALVHIMRNFSINGATPEKVDIDDFTALLTPKQSICLTMSKIH